jgi:hypothetical protein
MPRVAQRSLARPPGLHSQCDTASHPLHANHASCAPSLASKPRSELAQNNEWHFLGTRAWALSLCVFVCVCVPLFSFFLSFLSLLRYPYHNVLFPGNAGPSPFERHSQPVSSRSGLPSSGEKAKREGEGRCDAIK